MLRPYAILVLQIRRSTHAAPAQLFAQCSRKSKEPFDLAQDKPAGRRRYERRVRANSLRVCYLS